MKSLGEEVVDLVDETDSVIGRAARAEVRAANLRHRGIGVLCRRSTGELYVHRRTKTKDVFPCMYDMFVGGMVKAGEPYADAARRELAEELGVSGAPLRYLFKHFYSGEDNHCFSSIYEVTWDGPIAHQAAEIAWGAWMTEQDVTVRMKEWDFVPDGLEVWSRYVKERAG